MTMTIITSLTELTISSQSKSVRILNQVEKCDYFNTTNIVSSADRSSHNNTVKPIQQKCLVPSILFVVRSCFSLLFTFIADGSSICTTRDDDDDVCEKYENDRFLSCSCGIRSKLNTNCCSSRNDSICTVMKKDNTNDNSNISLNRYNSKASNNKMISKTSNHNHSSICRLKYDDTYGSIMKYCCYFVFHHRHIFQSPSCWRRKTRRFFLELSSFSSSSSTIARLYQGLFLLWYFLTAHSLQMPLGTTVRQQDWTTKSGLSLFQRSVAGKSPWDGTPKVLGSHGMAGLPSSHGSCPTKLMLAKRRNNNNNNRPTDNDMDHWYDEIDQNKSPDDIFWEEMERQRLLDSSNDGLSSSTTTSTTGSSASSPSSYGGFASPFLTGRGTVVGGSMPYANPNGSGGMGGMMGAVSGSYASTSSFTSPMPSSSASASSSLLIQQQLLQLQQQQPLTPQQQQKLKQQQKISLRTIDATLSEYEAYMVPDNWLDDDLVEFMMSNDEMSFEDGKFYDGVPSLDEQLDEWSKQPNSQQRRRDRDLIPSTSAAPTTSTSPSAYTPSTTQDDSTQLDAIDDDQNFEYYYEDTEDDDNSWMQSDEPWDHWTEATIKQTGVKSPSYDPDDDDRVILDPDKVRFGPASQFLFQPDDDDCEDNDSDESQVAQQEEQAFLNRISKITIFSERLQRAKDSPKAAAFFSRQPDSMEGFDRLWVSAIDNVCFSNLIGTFQNYGVEFADNFGDWEDQSVEDGLLYTIEEIASFKARQVYNVTGLPCIASRTSWEIEPVPDWNRIMPSNNVASLYPSAAAAAASASGGSINNIRQSSSVTAITNHFRVVSGYRFNDVGMHVDYICDALRPISDPNRVARFKTCLCFYDGQIEIFDYGTCDVDIYFCNSMRTFIPVAQAINEMMKTLELTFGLEYQKWLRTRIDEATSVGSGIRGPDGEFYPYGAASMKLRDRVLKEGKVLPNDIIDVSAFMDSMVDVNLMDECAAELANRFLDQKPTKLLTVATTGLVIALPMAKYLQVPVVYARKERNVVMADTYIAGYSSKTVGKNRELLIARSHLHQDDRVLIVDDFLSSGSSQEALLRIIAESGATAVGIGVLLEKVYDSGRQWLSGFGIPIHSLCRISSVKGGVIQLVEEEGFDRMAALETTKR